MTRVLLVPGRSAPLPEHWQSRWARQHPEYLWATPPDRPFDPASRVADLQDAIATSSEPAVLVAHSAGCLTVVRWAWLHDGPVRGALLVAPPYLGPGRRHRNNGDVTPAQRQAAPATSPQQAIPITSPQQVIPAASPQQAAPMASPAAVDQLPGPLPETPRDLLPFPSIVVASRTDPFAGFEQSRELAEAWGARLIDAGDAGHINTASGYGPWPAGQALLTELC